MARHIQKCQTCPAIIRRGALCPSCTRAAQRQQLEVGSIGREIARRRAQALLDIVAGCEAAADPQLVLVATPDGETVATLAAVAADQLAEAWGLKAGRA